MIQQRRLLLSAAILLLVASIGLYLSPAPAIAAAPAVIVQGPYVGSLVRGVSFDGDVRTLPKAPSALGSSAQPRLPRSAPAFRPAPGPSLLPLPRSAPEQRGPRLTVPWQIGLTFDGLQQTSFPDVNPWPPDSTGDVGRDYYIEAVNRSIGIYDKAGAQLASFAFHSIFTGTGTLCDTNPRDDPSVVYDSFTNRWMITFFAFVDLSHPFYQCFAVSKTGDPVGGGWWLYGMVADNAWLDDYPKFSVWPDAFYMTANMYRLGDSYKGVRVWALDRTNMYSGTLQSVYFTIPYTGVCCISLLPSTVRGESPPAGAPDYIMDAEMANPGHSLHLWKFHVDWTQPLSSTFTGPISLTVNAFDAFSGPGIPQRDSPELPDAGDDNLMTPLQYRRVNGIESLWASQTIGSGGKTALRWYEIRDPNGAPVVYQQGDFQLPDAEYRWMPSLSVDSQGNMALGYSVSGSDMDPAIRFTGRLATDPPGLLSPLEGSIIEGSGAQLGGYSRWGDYSAMSVDPADDCTFWYTNMYYPATGSNWHTRIGTFNFPTCPRPTAVSLESFRTLAGTPSQPMWPEAAVAAAGLVSFAFVVSRKKRRQNP